MLLVPVAFLACGLQMAAAQSQPAQKPPPPEELANEWFIRLNELDDWYISFDGKEENGARRRSLPRALCARTRSIRSGRRRIRAGAVVFHGKRRHPKVGGRLLEDVTPR